MDNWDRIETLEEKIEAQKKYCTEKNLPHFAPLNGKCWKCNNQIYDHITLNKASTSLITGCPVCCRSYCD